MNTLEENIVENDTKSEQQEQIVIQSEQKKARGRPKTKTDEEKKEAKRLLDQKYYNDPVKREHMKEVRKKYYQEHPENYRKQGYIMTEKYKESYRIIKELQSILNSETIDETNAIKNVSKDLKMKIIAI
jgi:hypothetical protein